MKTLPNRSSYKFYSVYSVTSGIVITISKAFLSLKFKIAFFQQTRLCALELLTKVDSGGDISYKRYQNRLAS